MSKRVPVFKQGREQAASWHCSLWLLEVTLKSWWCLLGWSSLALGQGHRRQSRPGAPNPLTTPSWAAVCAPTPQPGIKAKPCNEWLQHIPALVPALKWRRLLLLFSIERNVSSQLLKWRWKPTCKRKACCPYELKSLFCFPLLQTSQTESH